MNMDDGLKFDELAQTAGREFDLTRRRINQMIQRLETLLNGKTRSMLRRDFLISMVWLLAFFVFFGVIRNKVHLLISVPTLFVSVALDFTLLFEERMNSRYYGTILDYQSDLEKLKKKVALEKEKIRSNLSAFLDSQTGGWDYAIPVGPSVSEEMEEIEKHLSQMELYRNKYLKMAKTILYFTVTTAVTIAGSMALFMNVCQNMWGLDSRFLTWDVMIRVFLVTLVISCIAEAILSKYIWGKTDCSVTNLTLLVTMAGPVIFYILAHIFAFFTFLVLFIAHYFIYIMLIIFAIAFVAAVIRHHQ